MIPARSGGADCRGWSQRVFDSDGRPKNVQSMMDTMRKRGNRERERKEKKRKEEKEKRKVSGLFEFSKPDFMPFSIFRNEVSFSRILNRDFAF